MKLHNYTLKYLAITLLSIIALWGILFYVHIRQQIGESLDRNLNNHKLDFIQSAQKDTTVLVKFPAAGNIYQIIPFTEEEAIQVRDEYEDSSMDLDGEKVPARKLTSAFKLNGNYYRLEVTTSTLEEELLAKNILYGTIALYLALLLCVLFINNLLLKKLWRPFYSIIGQMKRFRLGTSTRLSTPPTRIAEFVSLSQTLESLITRAEDTFSSQRQFVENASHELQTPLAVSLNRLELLLENESLSPNAAQAVSQVVKALERLSRLNKTLLLLTRIENNQFLDKTTVDFNKLVHTLSAEFEELLHHRNINIQIREGTTPLLYSMNEDLAATLVVNLFKNAIVHNTDHGDLIISLQHHKLEIANSGAEGPLDPKRMFDRFYKNSSNKQSTGLGLAIVKAIVYQYGLKIDYTYKDTLHVITILFPINH